MKSDLVVSFSDVGTNRGTRCIVYILYCSGMRHHFNGAICGGIPDDDGKALIKLLEVLYKVMSTYVKSIAVNAAIVLKKIYNDRSMFLN